MYHHAPNLGREVRVEVHDEVEMERALAIQPEIIGINNRNLKTFEVNLATTEKLASYITNPNTILISESGMRVRQDVERVGKVGAEAILVGETLMRSDDLNATFSEMQIPLSKGSEQHAR